MTAVLRKTMMDVPRPAVVDYWIFGVTHLFAQRRIQRKHRQKKQRRKKRPLRKPLFGVRSDWEQFYLTIFTALPTVPELPQSIFQLIMDCLPSDPYEIVMVCDSFGLWNLAQILQIKFDAEAEFSPLLRVNYLGWTTMLDEWISIDSNRIQTITKQVLLPTPYNSFKTFHFSDLRSYIFYKILRHTSVQSLSKLRNIHSSNQLSFELLVTLATLIDSINLKTLSTRRTKFANTVLPIPETMAIDINSDNDEMSRSLFILLSLQHSLPIIGLENTSNKLRRKAFKVSLEESILYFGNEMIDDVINRGALVIASHAKSLKNKKV